MGAPVKIPETSEALERRLDELRVTLGPMATTIAENPSSTLQPADPELDSTAEHALDGLRRAPSSTGTGLDLGDTLGQGGMGVVHLALQRSMGREVAVKTLRRDVPGDVRTALRLLREAWITGWLEHPNIVPVHDVIMQEGDHPMVVLKRIQGDVWASLLEDEAEVRRRFGATDVLLFHLQTFLKVCDAVRFAHDRGVIHRDLKPDNIMLGEFGEVYVVDWGLAVSLRDDGTGRLPLAKHVRGVAGTPHYMAPEMLDGSGKRLSGRTDVYLLGAILYEVVTGDPPHSGEGVMPILRSVVNSPPEIPKSVPAELAEICTKAMRADPGDRFEDVQALERAVERFLEHRASAALTADTNGRLEELLRCIDGANRVAGGQLEERNHIENLFSECQFGYRSARRSWPGNEEAKAGMNRALRAMIDYELTIDDPRAASSHLADLGEDDDALRARVDAALDKKRSEERHRDALAQDRDQHLGLRTRVAIGAFLGFLWMLVPLGVLIVDAGPPTYPQLFGWSVGFLAMVFAAWIWGRESMEKTLVNRTMMLVLSICMSAEVALVAIGQLQGLDPASLLPFMMLLGGVAAAVVQLTVLPGLWPTTLAYTAGAILGAAEPRLLYWALLFANAVLVLNALTFLKDRKPLPPGKP